jgi:hypothetical protein
VGDAFKIEVTNIKAAQQMYRVSRQKAHDAFQETILEMAAALFAQSQGLVPRDTGALAGSGTLTRESFRGGDKLVLKISYGGPAAGYALYVHENLLSAHASPTSAKFLEIPFNLLRPKIKRTIDQKIKAKLG